MTPVTGAILAALAANLFVGGVAYGLTSAPRRHLAILADWCARTFTKAGDNLAADAAFVPSRPDADEIVIAARAGIVDLAARRRQLLSASESSPFRRTVH
jgi:hypothetical protein